MAKTAKAWAKRCQFKHNTYLKEPGQTHPRFASVGENIWTGSLSIFSVKEAITSWYNEVKDYSYTANSCRRVCGHYTQVGMELLHLNQEPALLLGHRNFCVPTDFCPRFNKPRAVVIFCACMHEMFLHPHFVKEKSPFFFFLHTPVVFCFQEQAVA